MRLPEQIAADLKKAAADRKAIDDRILALRTEASDVRSRAVELLNEIDELLD